MRRCFVVLLCFCLCFASAFVDVDSSFVEKEYVFSYEIKGKVNLTVEDESYNEMIFLSDGKTVSFADFLIENKVDFECFPADCSMSYSYSSGDASKNFSISSSESEYVGFILKGKDIVLDSFSFNISSDFEAGAEVPFVIEFFEDKVWTFSNFSSEFLPKNWGCFDPSDKSVGPLIGNSFYCEMVEIGSSSSLRVGADVSGEGGNLNMAVYPESGFGSSWECSFDPSFEDGCVVDPEKGELFSEGRYQICVGADSLTTYNIYEENKGDSCGFSYDSGPASSVKDYAVFVQGVKYASAEELGGIDFSDKVDSANSIIATRYGGDCLEGCVLPLKISGVSQEFSIQSVDLVYKEDSEWKSENFAYDLTSIPAEVDFNGTLDLGKLHFNVLKEGEHSAELFGEYLFKENIILLPAPIVSSITPLVAPAAVPVTFYAKIDFEGNDSLNYKWDFGDDKAILESYGPQITYVYNDLRNYTLSLEVSAGGNLTSKKNFNIEVISPEIAIAEGLKIRKDALVKVRSDIRSLSSWYEKDLLNLLDVDYFEDELDRLEKEHGNAIDVEEFRDIALKLYALNVPVGVGANNFESPSLMTELGDIDIDPISSVSGSPNGDNHDAYIDAILVWQSQNVFTSMKNKNVFAVYWNGDDRDVLSSYSFDVASSWDRESYFVINRPFGELYFNEEVGARKSEDATVIVLGAGESKSFEFYYKDKSRGKFFVSPSLSSLVIEEDINTDCNFNLICEEAMGEDASNCRSDCKPIGRAVFIFIFVVILLLAAYTGLHIWYKRHYEKYLFGEGQQLYNLLMYISNARAHGLEDKDIIANLKSEGWSSEKVKYGISKSLGKNVGMVEIVPIEKISMLIRDWKARRAIKKSEEAATQVQQQDNNNINKSGARV